MSHRDMNQDSLEQETPTTTVVQSFGSFVASWSCWLIIVKASLAAAAVHPFQDCFGLSYPSVHYIFPFFSGLSHQ